MPTALKVYVNEDDALLFWSIPAPIAGCRGFAIARRLQKDGAGPESETFLPNRMGFEDEAVAASPTAGQEAVTRPSSEWPFQRFSWTDHDADTGDTVSYRVIPVVRGGDGALALVEAEGSEWSPPRTLGAAAQGKLKPFFNRGFVMSQFMARYLAERQLTLAQFKATIGDQDDRTIRRFLSGDLRLALLAELAKAHDEGGQVYAALFELADEELLSALCALGSRAHVVLANGSITAAKGEPAAEARKRDENEAARGKLRGTDVAADVEVDNRFLSPGPLGHNKFLVRTDKDGNAVAAWTGSTNWTPTGLCTQVNNGLLIEDPDVAAVYLAQWRRLREAKSAFPKSLVAENSQPKPVGETPPGRCAASSGSPAPRRGSTWTPCAPRSRRRSRASSSSCSCPARPASSAPWRRAPASRASTCAAW